LEIKDDDQQSLEQDQTKSSLESTSRRFKPYPGGGGGAKLKSP
jgi:hypothetical protein